MPSGVSYSVSFVLVLYASAACHWSVSEKLFKYKKSFDTMFSLNFFFKRLVNKFWQQFWDILKMKFGQSFWIREGVQLFALLFSLCDFSVVYVLSLADNQDLKVRISFCYFQPWPPNAYYENGFCALRFYNPY